MGSRTSSIPPGLSLQRQSSETPDTEHVQPEAARGNLHHHGDGLEDEAPSDGAVRGLTLSPLRV
jgi:hypothetical protein